METLSSTEACLFGREAGDKEKERAWGAMGKGSGDFSLFPSPLARFLFFDHCYFYWDTQREPLRRREPWKRSRKNCLHDGSMVTTLVVICNTRFCHFHPFFFTKHAKVLVICQSSCDVKGYGNLRCHWCISIHLLSRFYSRLLLVKLSVVQSLDLVVSFAWVRQLVVLSTVPVTVDYIFKSTGYTNFVVRNNFYYMYMLLELFTGLRH